MSVVYDVFQTDQYTARNNKVLKFMRSLIFFHFYEALHGAFDVQVFRASFVTLSKTLIACRDMQLKFLKSENIVKQLKASFNNVFTFKNLSYMSLHAIRVFD